MDDFGVLSEKYIQRYQHGIPTASGWVLDRVCDGIVKGLGEVSVRRTPANLLNHLHKALQDLRSNSDIVISKVDRVMWWW